MKKLKTGQISLSKKLSTYKLVNFLKYPNIDLFFYIVFILFIQLYFAKSFIFKYLPLTEGWWHIYAKWISRGLLPYRDFELLVTPGYPFLIFFLEKIGIDNLYEFRIIGFFIQFGINLILFLIAIKLTNSKKLSFSISVLISIYLQSGVAYINYDYIYINILFFLICLYLLIVAMHNSSQIFPILSALFLFLSLMIKQSQGIYYIFFIFTWLLLYSIQKKSNKIIIFFSLAFTTYTALFLAYLYTTDSFSSFLQQIFLSTQTKGGVSHLAFNWLLEITKNTQGLINTFNNFTSLILFFGLLVLIFYYLKKSLVYYLALLFSVSVFLLFKEQYILDNFAKYIFSIGLISIIFFIPLKILGDFDSKMSLLWFSSLAVLWGCGSSAGLTEIGLYLPVFFGLILIYKIVKSELVLSTVIILISLIYLNQQILMKIDSPFNWWGYSVENVNKSQYILDNDFTGRLQVNFNTREVLENVTNIIHSNKCNKDVFVFPHMPIFQLYSNQIPNYYLAVTWFDFSSKKGLKIQQEQIKSNNPGVIIIIDPPSSVWEGHAKLFNAGQDMPQMLIKGQLRELTNTTNYSKKYETKINNQYYLEIFTKNC